MQKVKDTMYNPKFNYHELSRTSEEGKRLYSCPDGSRVPSVTTILDKTKPAESRAALEQWRKNVGHAKAQQITTEAASRGTSMHKSLECFVAGIPRKPGNNLVHQISNKMADVIIENGLSKMNEIWALEQSLYFPKLYSGTTDGVGVYNGEPVIFDYKQSNKPKQESYVDDYKMQLVAYILCHNEVYGTNIKQGVIFMAVKPPELSPGVFGESKYQQFDLLPKDFNYWQDQWLTKVEEYYKLNP